jgi:electron transport complex protein RnfC
MKQTRDIFFNDRISSSDAVSAYLPATAYVALPPGTVADVNPGSRVDEGQLIAVGSHRYDTAIHSPIPGTFEEFVRCPLPAGGTGIAARIRFGGHFSYSGKHRTKTHWETLDTEELCDLIAKNGVLNLFFRPVSLARQIITNRRNQGSVLILRFYDTDTSCVTDSFVAKRYQAEIAQAAAILARTAGISAVALLYTAGGLPPDEGVFRKALSGCGKNCALAVVPVTVHNRLGATGGEMVDAVRAVRDQPVFAQANHTSLMVDPVTLFHLYWAVVFSLPVMESIVHISGTAIKQPGMFFIRNGMLIRDILEECGGLEKYAAIVINGVISGSLITSLNTPITRQVKSIRFLRRSELSNQRAHECIRCGNCRAVCPVNLEPSVLFEYLCGICEADPKYLATAVLCQDCALCSTVCPARLPLVQAITRLKESIVDETQF